MKSGQTTIRESFKRGAEVKQSDLSKSVLPDFMKIAANKKQKDSTKGEDIQDQATLISKFNGWLTVNKETKNRKKAIENDNLTNPDQLAKVRPTWMSVATARSIGTGNVSGSVYSKHRLNSMNASKGAKKLHHIFKPVSMKN